MTQEQQILEGLYNIGFLFPDTAARVEAYEKYQKVFGDPDINFPTEEQELMFEKIMSRLKNRV